MRDTHGIDKNSPLSFFDVKLRVDAALRAYVGRYAVVPLPNITHVLYGRDVGYLIECIQLDPAVEAISATAIRQQLNGADQR